MRWLLLLALLPMMVHAESRMTGSRTAHVSVYFKVVIPSRARSIKIYDPTIPLGRGERRQVQQLPDGRVLVTLVRP